MSARDKLGRLFSSENGVSLFAAIIGVDFRTGMAIRRVRLVPIIQKTPFEDLPGPWLMAIYSGSCHRCHNSDLCLTEFLGTADTPAIMATTITS